MVIAVHKNDAAFSRAIRIHNGPAACAYMWRQCTSKGARGKADRQNDIWKH